MVMTKSLPLITLALGIVCADAMNPTISYGGGTWRGPFYTDIPGTGMGGTYEWGLQACKSRCQNKASCQASQYGGWYTFGSPGKNCFIYNNQNDTAAELSGFKLYKFDRNSGGGGGANWGGAIYKDIYGTGIDGGSTQWSLGKCKSHCAQTSRCKTAEYSSIDRYKGFNCFIYDTQLANEPQLKSFKMYYYKGHSSSWSAPIYRDIDGAGMGGTTEWSLDACKRRCYRESTCQTAQFCAYCSYRNPTNGKTSNCFIYDNQNVNQPRLKQFILYKLNRGGCGQYGQCPNRGRCKTSYIDFCWGRLFATEDGLEKGSWDDEDKVGNIMNVALPVLLSIGAVLAVVSAVRFTRARLSQRAISVPVEEPFVDTEGLVEEVELEVLE